MSSGIKHLIECHCTLPQLRDRNPPIYHRFVVFSQIDDDDNVIVKNAQCNNCGVIHRILDIGKSEIAQGGKDDSASLVNIEDIKLSLPQNVINVLESYAVSLPTWEEVQWIIDNKKWGSFVVLASEERSGMVEGKMLQFIDQQRVKIEPYSMSITFSGK